MMKQKKNLNNINYNFREIAPYLGIGIQLAATIILMLVIGNWLDQKFEKKYLFTIIFAILGMASGLYNLIHTLNYLEKKKNFNKSEQ